MSTARPLRPRSPSPFSTDCPQRNLSTGCPGSRMDCARHPCHQSAVHRPRPTMVTQSDDPAFEFAMNATCRPSGDTLKSTARFVWLEPSGGRIGNSTSSGTAGAAPRRLSSIVPPNVSARAAATIQPRRGSRAVTRLRADVCGTEGAAGVRAMCASAHSKSAAD